MSRIGTFRARHVRRRILETLRAAASAGGEGWISLNPLLRFLSGEIDTLTRSEIDDEVRYLADPAKAYAQIRDVREREGDPRRLQTRILARGVDLLEGNIDPDPGVEDDRPRGR
ncbi:MAG TPA: hypothetical protein VFH53_05675 [Phycisphaerae bacterium]|nr:hypothetical protein [Phycisphaerae bacterium]